MSFLWFIFAIFQLGSYAKRSNYMFGDDEYDDYNDEYDDYSQALQSQFYYPAAAQQSVNNDYYDTSDYNTDLYNQMVYNQMLYNQMAYNQMYQQNQQSQMNQMNAIYQQMLMDGQQQQYAGVDYDDYGDFDYDDYAAALALEDDEFLGGVFKKIKDKFNSALAGRYKKSEEKMTKKIEQCSVDYPPGNAFKTISNIALVNPGGAGVPKEQFQAFFTHCVYQLDIFLDEFVTYAEKKAYSKMNLDTNSLAGKFAKPLIDGFAKGLLEDSFQGIVDKVFMKMVHKIADMNAGLTAPPNFNKGDREPTPVSMETFNRALKQFRFKEAFSKAIGWISCKFLTLLRKGMDRFWPTMKKGAMNMMKRMGTNWLAMKLVKKLTMYATLAFDDLTKEVRWTPDMFKDWLKCLKEKKASINAVPDCFKKIDKQYGITEGLRKGAQNAGRNTVKRAKADVAKAKADIKAKVEELKTKGAERLTAEALKVAQKKASARVMYNDEYYEYGYDDEDDY